MITTVGLGMIRILGILGLSVIFGANGFESDLLEDGLVAVISEVWFLQPTLSVNLVLGILYMFWFVDGKWSSNNPACAKTKVT